MTAAAIIERAAADGLTLALTPAGTIKAIGGADAIKHWQAILREHKPIILGALQEAQAACFNNAITGDPISDDSERRRSRALAILAQDPDLRCAVVCEAGEPGRVMVAIRGVGSGELEIPADRYDAFTLLALMDQYAAQPSNAVH